MIIVSQRQAVTPDVRESQALPGFRVALIGADGVTWDLENGPVYLGESPEGIFDAPTVGPWLRTSPTTNGARRDGQRTAERTGTLPLIVTGLDWADWRSNDRNLFRSLSDQGECLLAVTAPDAQTRYLGLTFISGGGNPIDPIRSGNVAGYAFEVAILDPFWRGDPVALPLPISAPRGMFRGHTDLTQTGPFLPINVSRSGATVTVTNPGDQPVWPTYTVTGPMSSWQVGVGDALVASEVPLSAGQSVTINTDPFELNITDQDGAYVYEYLSSDNFAAIPAGADVLLTRTVNGINIPAASQLAVEFTPLYRRPW